jgi:osmotically-inducible protein OsmY
MKNTMSAAAIGGLALLISACSALKDDGTPLPPYRIPNNMSEHTNPYEPDREAREGGMLSQSTANSASRAATAPSAAPLAADAKDAYLQGRIETIYDLNPRLASQDLTARVVGGTVYLSGTVDSDIERDLAVDLARSVDDVQGVQSTLAVKTPPPVVDEPAVVDDRSMSERMDDANVTAAVRQALVDDPRTRVSGIEVATFRGQVTLAGLVDSSDVGKAAEAIAAGVPGVTGVTNGLTVR